MLVRHALVLLMLLVTSFNPARADELTTEKRADIEQLLAMTGAVSLGKQMAGAVVANLSQNLKKARPDIPQNVIDLLPTEVMAVFEENIGSLVEVVIPIYHTHFTGAEVKELIRFYSTETGQKIIKVLPGLMQESMTAGQRWGQALAPLVNQRITDKLRREGVKI